jgi:transposase
MPVDYWQCADSLSLRSFVGVPLTKDTPDHSLLSYIRDCLPQETHEAVFCWVLKLASDKQVLKGKTVAVDFGTLESNAKMKSIARRDTGEDWRSYVIGIIKKEGVTTADAKPTDEEARNFDKNRCNKAVPNTERMSSANPDARIARMKDGATHLPYKAKLFVDLDLELILAFEVTHVDQSNIHTGR